MAKKLIQVLNSHERNLLIGINAPYQKKDFKSLKKHVLRYYHNYFQKYKFKLAKIINKQNLYYSALISRFYIDKKNNKGIKNFIKKLKKVWEKKDILIIEGEGSRLGIGNDLFDNIKSIERIICPSENSFNVYDKIINQTLKVNKNKLILIALGPTATVLAYDLYKLGYQAIDIGHVDIEYEWYIRKAKKKIKIENKYVNEVRNGRKKITKIKDKKYYSQIIAIINN